MSAPNIVNKNEAVNRFCERKDLSPTEDIVAKRLIAVERALTASLGEREKLEAALKQKTAEVGNLAGQKESLIEVAFAMELIISNRTQESGH